MGAKASFSIPIPILIPKVQPGSTRFGLALLIADMDKDGVADLIVGNPDSMVTGDVYVYLAASEYWLSGTPNRDGTFMLGFPGIEGALIDRYKLGDSLAVGDIDGDTFPDLMVGAASRLSIISGYR